MISNLILLLCFSFTHASFDQNECGVSKGCWVPDTLCWGGDCDGMAASYKVINDSFLEVELTVETKSNFAVYVAVGFSDDYYMGNDSVIECSSIGKEDISMKFSYNGVYNNPEDNTNSRVSYNPDQYFFHNVVEYNNGVLYCKSLVLVDGSTKNTFKYDPNQQYYLLLVSGQTSATGLTHHDFDSTSPATYLQNYHIGFNNLECGKTKGCVLPNECNGMGMSHRVIDNETIFFEIFGNIDASAPAYVAIAFSDDKKMGNDSVLECSEIDGLSMKFSYNNEKPTNVRIDGENGVRSSLITNQTGYNENGYLYCSALVKVSGSSISDRIFKWDQNEYYFILFATGPTNVTQLGHHKHTCINSSPVALQELQPNFDTSTCGTEKACFMPDDCPEGCDGMMVSYKSVGDYLLEIELTSRQSLLNRYVAVGFSTTGAMGNTSVIECSSIQGTQYSMKFSYNIVGNGHYANNRTVGNTTGYITNQTIVFQDGLLYCKAIFNVSGASDDPTVFRYIPTVPYYLLLAEGGTNGATLGYHDMKTISTKRYLDEFDPTPEPPPDNGQAFNSTQCGITKACYLPDGMTNFGVAYRMVSDTVMQLELMSSTTSPYGLYVAVGFSTDTKMARTNVIECSALQGDALSMKFSYNDDTTNKRVTMNDDLTSKINSQTVSYENGYIYCYAEIDVSENVDPQVFQYSPGQFYYLLLAKGSTSTVGLTQHTKTSISTMRLLTDLNAGNEGASTSKLIIAHAILMVLAWYVFVPTALLFARVLRSSWPTVKPGGLLIWFHVHRTSNMFAIILMITAFVLVLSAKNWLWVKPASSWGGKHAILGIISLCLAWVQPFISTLRCTPDNPRRPLFNNVHRAIGIIAFVFATSAIALAGNNFVSKNNTIILVISLIPLVLISTVSVAFVWVDKKVDVHDRNIQKIQKIRQFTVYSTIGLLAAVGTALSVLIAIGL